MLNFKKSACNQGEYYVHQEETVYCKTNIKITRQKTHSLKKRFIWRNHTRFTDGSQLFPSFKHFHGYTFKVRTFSVLAYDLRCF